MRCSASQSFKMAGFISSLMRVAFAMLLWNCVISEEPNYIKPPPTCADKPCKNSGYCHTQHDGSFKCECIQVCKRYVGETCAYESLPVPMVVDEPTNRTCADKPCKNGMCRDMGDSFICYCSKFCITYAGETCSDNADDLENCDEQPGPCEHDGTCKKTPTITGGKECVCKPKTSGLYCEIAKDGTGFYSRMAGGGRK